MLGLILSLFINGLIQLALWMAPVLLAGVIIALLNNLFYKLVGTESREVCLATGCIGTPIHELGHAIFCLIFAHKIKEIKLYNVGDDGVLGYVKHSYNPKNLYQKLGQFFIGIGPIVFGSGVLILLILIFQRSCFNAFATLMKDMGENIAGGISFGALATTVWSFLKLFFSVESLGSWSWWVLLVLGCMISLHMRLSKADIKGAMTGFWLTVIFVGVAPIILGIISRVAMNAVLSVSTRAAVYMLCIYVMAIIYSCLSLIPAAIYAGIKAIVLKAKKKPAQPA